MNRSSRPKRKRIPNKKYAKSSQPTKQSIVTSKPKTTRRHLSNRHFVLGFIRPHRNLTCFTVLPDQYVQPLLAPSVTWTESVNSVAVFVAVLGSRTVLLIQGSHNLSTRGSRVPRPARMPPPPPLPWPVWLPSTHLCTQIHAITYSFINLLTTSLHYTR